MRILCLCVAVFALPGAALWAQDRALEAAAKEISNAIEQSKGVPVGIGNFTNRQGYDDSFSRYVSQNLGAMISSVKPSTVVARSREDIQQLMAEQALRYSSEFDVKFYQKLGKLAGAAAIVCGSYEVGDGVINLNYKLVGTSDAVELHDGFVEIPRTPEINKRLAENKLDGEHMLQVAGEIGLVAMEHGGYSRQEDDEIRHNILRAERIDVLMPNGSSFTQIFKKELGTFLANSGSSMRVIFATANSEFYREETDMTFNGNWDKEGDAYKADQGLVAFSRQRLTDLAANKAKIDFKYFNTQFRLPVILIDDTYCYLTIRLSPNESPQSLRLEFKATEEREKGFVESCKAHFNKLWSASSFDPENKKK